MKYALFTLALTGLFACSQTPEGAGNQQKNKNYQTFQYSKKTSTQSAIDPANWCIARFGEAALVSADPKNFYRRLFALGDVPSRIVLDGGKQTATFMLSPNTGHVDLYTSDNQPACLSNKLNFQLSPDGVSFQYNNKMGIKFDVYLQELSNGIQIAIDFPKDAIYGMSVYRCETCK